MDIIPVYRDPNILDRSRVPIQKFVLVPKNWFSKLLFSWINLDFILRKPKSLLAKIFWRWIDLEQEGIHYNIISVENKKESK